MRKRVPYPLASKTLRPFNKLYFLSVIVNMISRLFLPPCDFKLFVPLLHGQNVEIVKNTVIFGAIQRMRCFFLRNRLRR